MAQYGRVDRVRLLVVDDDPPIADLVATVARYEGWEAVTAHTGEEALRRADAFRPDIVVLDLMLPDVDGFGVLDGLRRSGGWCRWCSSPRGTGSPTGWRD